MTLRYDGSDPIVPPPRSRTVTGAEIRPDVPAGYGGHRLGRSPSDAAREETGCGCTSGVPCGRTGPGPAGSCRTRCRPASGCTRTPAGATRSRETPRSTPPRPGRRWRPGRNRPTGSSASWRSCPRWSRTSAASPVARPSCGRSWTRWNRSAHGRTCSGCNCPARSARPICPTSTGSCVPCPPPTATPLRSDTPPSSPTPMRPGRWSGYSAGPTRSGSRSTPPRSSGRRRQATRSGRRGRASRACRDAPGR